MAVSGKLPIRRASEPTIKSAPNVTEIPSDTIGLSDLLAPPVFLKKRCC